MLNELEEELKKEKKPEKERKNNGFFFGGINLFKRIDGDMEKDLEENSPLLSKLE